MLKSGYVVPRHAIPSLALSCFLFVQFLQIRLILPMVEFSEWIFPGNGTLIQVFKAWIESLFQFESDSYNGRITSLYYAQTIGIICKQNLTCINFFAYLPFLLTVVMVYLLLIHIKLSPWLSLVTCICISLSLPAEGILSWQATILDRLATLTFVCFLYLAINLSTTNSLSLKRKIFYVVGLNVTFLMAVTTKESALAVIPAGAILIVIKIWKMKGRLTDQIMFIGSLPTLSLAVLMFLRNYNLASIEHHNVGNEALTGIQKLTSYLIGNEDIGLTIFFCLIIFFAVRVIIDIRSSNRELEKIEITSLVLFLTALVSWAIPVRTQYLATFYVWQPLVILVICVAYFFRESLKNVRRETLFALCMCILPVVAIASPGNAISYSSKTSSKLLSQSPEIREARQNLGQERLSFQIKAGDPLSYMFFTTNPASALLRFFDADLPVDGTYRLNFNEFSCDDVKDGVIVLEMNSSFKIIQTCTR